VRILRYVGGNSEEQQQEEEAEEEEATGTPLSPLFIKIYDVFLVSGVKLLIFMDECNSSRILYDLVKSTGKIASKNVREWAHAIARGVHKLQCIGVARVCQKERAQLLFAFTLSSHLYHLP